MHAQLAIVPTSSNCGDPDPYMVNMLRNRILQVGGERKFVLSGAVGGRGMLMFSVVFLAGFSQRFVRSALQYVLL